MIVHQKKHIKAIRDIGDADIGHSTIKLDFCLRDMLFELHAEKITNRCPPASPELATRLPCIKYALFILLIMLAGTRRQN